MMELDSIYISKDMRYIIAWLAICLHADGRDYPTRSKVVATILCRDGEKYPEWILNGSPYYPHPDGGGREEIFYEHPDSPTSYLGNGMFEAKSFEEFWDKTRELIPGVEWEYSEGLAEAVQGLVKRAAEPLVIDCEI